MEQVVEVLGTVLRVMLAGTIALAPGMLVWTVVLSVFLVIRWVGRSRPFEALRQGGRAA